jgi:hypothetical protein
VLIEELATPKEGAEPTRLAGYAQPFTVQFMALMKRALNEYWRFPGVSYGQKMLMFVWLIRSRT